MDKILKFIATAAEKAAKDSVGFASRGGAFEPELPQEVKYYKAVHASKLETLFDKIVK